MARVAFFTSALLQAPFESDHSQGFRERAGMVFDAAVTGPGYLASAFADSETDGMWGDVTVPHQYRSAEYDGRLAQFYTLWRDLESVYAYAYNGLHAAALRQRKEWFVARPMLSYVIWWVDDDYIPSWQEACERYQRLHEAGASAEAFDFRHPFGADGQPTQLNRDLIKQHAAHYRNNRHES
jgi:hypothetical protein